MRVKKNIYIYMYHSITPTLFLVTLILVSRVLSLEIDKLAYWALLYQS